MKLNTLLPRILLAAGIAGLILWALFNKVDFIFNI